MNDQPAAPPPGLNYEDWAGEMGDRWLANLESFERTLAPIGEALLAHADLRSGERVIDLGCGGGATTQAIARAVGPQGAVVGLDISPQLTAVASQRAMSAGITNARFQCADAASATVPDAPYDRLFSRFGSMFFADPAAAFAHLHSMFRAGGRIDLAVWGPPPENPWMFEPMGIARRYLDLPAPVPRAPGPFAFEDRDYLTEVLETAGFRDVSIVAATGKLGLDGPGTSPEGATAFARNAMAFTQLLAAAPEPVRKTVESELLALFTRHHEGAEGVRMGYSVWLVSAFA